eukprot:GEMP01062080.1.p1 GENE.GEMP01062080.1~~GEMP01062080.1.p1  ORF type:complete len:153 (+),score=19.89 GEMP01062080.1:25-459(+)
MGILNWIWPEHSMHHVNSFNGPQSGLELRDYYGSACPHCQHLDPEWDKAATMNTGPVKFRKIECADGHWNPVEKNAALCRNIDGYPTIKLFKDGDEVADFNGPRTADGLVDFAQNYSAAKQMMPILPLLPFVSVALKGKTTDFF